MIKNINPYKQHGMTCAIACMLMVLEYYKIIPKANYLYEQKYFKSYHSRYTDGTPFSALAWHFTKNGLYTEIVHSEKEIFTNKNNVFPQEVYNDLIDEYQNYLKYAKEKDAIITNGIDIDSMFLKRKLEEDKLIILAGQIDNILHAILICGCDENNFIICDPLFKQKQIRSFNDIDKFMETSIGKWCVIVSKKEGE